MGWYYRKSKSVGPFRVNLSKSGVGFSVGGRGFRSGVNARGRRYTTASVPGTGLRYRKNHPTSSTGCLVVAVAAATLATGICCFARFLEG
jgi:hypothetical protein